MQSLEVVARSKSEHQCHARQPGGEQSITDQSRMKGQSKAIPASGASREANMTSELKSQKLQVLSSEEASSSFRSQC